MYIIIYIQQLTSYEDNLHCNSDLNCDTSDASHKLSLHLQKAASSNYTPHWYSRAKSSQYQTLHTGYFCYEWAMLLFDRVDTEGMYMLVISLAAGNTILMFWNLLPKRTLNIIFTRYFFSIRDLTDKLDWFSHPIPIYKPVWWQRNQLNG